MKTLEQLIGVIGWPVSHSKSPAMHNAAFHHLGLPFNYAFLPVPPSPTTRLQEAVLGLRALGFRGANVTVPYKQLIIPHLDRVSFLSTAIGSVNTIVVEEDGTLYGDSTDGYGFATHLKEEGVEVCGKDVVVLGAGGSAHAVAYALLDLKCASLTIQNRTPSKAEHLRRVMLEIFPGAQILCGTNPNADLIVNCTAPGFDYSSLEFRSDQTVYDLNYYATPLLEHAQKAGARTLNSLGMLLHQGAKSFEMWTGHKAPLELMRQAL